MTTVVPQQSMAVDIDALAADERRIDSSATFYIASIIRISLVRAITEMVIPYKQAST